MKHELEKGELWQTVRKEPYSLVSHEGEEIYLLSAQLCWVITSELRFIRASALLRHPLRFVLHLLPLIPDDLIAA
jgi:hypothetical protein